ncbi:hypothetical protein DLAC_00144 [Tieghemostelium lacteum]|uniref:Uncharacterized protein n=1 Tax=Tieghemostelium lacteum TaxID=361077 RepID=A0A152A979_TIELA|nr:hypothetical protein DLAC_00144 [Tieghemostelium lacteum]|eukprot:KYR02685.1 hypothetical protein DLAC_00144 [Tieghemostelium lacteum]
MQEPCENHKQLKVKGFYYLRSLVSYDEQLDERCNMECRKAIIEGYDTLILHLQKEREFQMFQKPNQNGSFNPVDRGITYYIKNQWE